MKNSSVSEASARMRVSIAILCGLIAAVVTVVAGQWKLAPLIGWDAAAITYILWVWLTVWPMDEKQTADHALVEDPTRTTSEFTLLGASVASLGALAVVLVKASSAAGSTKALLAGLGIASVILSWIVVHTIYVLRYAVLYYGEPRGGVDFGGEKQPAYADFAYLAFTIGMTFQVSDTGFNNRAFRKLALRHAMLAYVFGTLIVATTINLIAGLNK
ncbi:MAG TPA: DUF1345 domain-containing protein [Candidatus Saccharimonadales bacterium]|nr:DUF1345 domain-containing protein [Candidatus Saccharimonadales bacterium]